MHKQITRRAFCSILLALPFTAQAQQPKKIHRIGYLSGRTHRGSPNAEALRQGLRDLAYVEGQNITIEYRSTEGHFDRYPGLVAELVRLKVDIIFAAGGEAGRAARKVTSAVPIIFVGSVDPVATGMADSLARPGGNLTGFSTGAPGLYGKRLEIIKETLPRLSRVGVLLNPTNPNADVALKEIQAAGEDLGVKVQSLDVRSLNDINRAFEAATKAQVGALVVAQQTPITFNLNRIAELAAMGRLPAIYTEEEWVHAGGLMSYGPNIPDLYRRAADYVDKILKGRPPSDLPVQQPMKYELMINLKTAKALGLTIPPVVLVRAEKVIK